MLEVFKKGYKARMQNGYKVISAKENSEKFLVLEGEYTTIVPIKNDIKKIYLEVTNECNF